MAVLLPVLLLAGPGEEAVRAARADRRGRHDRLVLREHGGDAGRVPVLPRARRARAARQGASRRSSTASPSGYSRTLRRVLPFRADDHRRVGRPGRGERLGGVAPAEHVLPRDRRVDGADLRALLAGHRRCRTPRRQINDDGRDARRASCRQGWSRWSSPTSASPSNARSAMISPNVGPHTGFLRLALLRSRGAQDCRKRRDRRPGRGRSWTREFPGVETPAVSGRAGRQRLRQRVHRRPLVVEVRGDNLEELDAQAKAIAEVARTVPGVRDVRSSLQMDYPEIHVDTDREKAGLRRRDGRDAPRRRRWRRRSATSTRRASGSIRNNGQSYYVVTSYDGAASPTSQRARAAPGPRRATPGNAVLLGAYGTIRRVGRARSPSSAISSSAPRTC